MIKSSTYLQKTILVQFNKRRASLVTNLLPLIAFASCIIYGSEIYIYIYIFLMSSGTLRGPMVLLCHIVHRAVFIESKSEASRRHNVGAFCFQIQ